jgi:hypothetical protein
MILDNSPKMGIIVLYQTIPYRTILYKTNEREGAKRQYEEGRYVVLLG